MKTDRTLAALQRRLDKWELQHLRALVVELHERCEAAERRAEDAEDRMHNAEVMADFWQHEAMDGGASVGITQDGELVSLRAH